MKLSPEQISVVEHRDGGLAVTAGAGTGKSTTLVALCKKRLESNPETRITAVSFTEKSVSDLRAKLSESLPGARGRWQVLTIHGLCGAVVRAFPSEAGIDGEERVLDESATDELWREAVDRLWNGDIPPEVERSLLRLLESERRASLPLLLGRVRALRNAGSQQRLVTAAPESLSGALAQVFEWAYGKFEARKKRLGVLEYDDLEWRALQALASERVQTHFKKNIDLLLVDEFQDTNAVQAQVIWSIARDQGSNLVVVGDPKQSIYRFRDADLSVFEERKASLGARKSLTQNYRSVPNVIDFVNKVCEPLFTQSDLEYEPLVASSGSPDGAVERLDVEDPDEFARWLKNGWESAPETALILRKIKGNEAWIRALLRAGIPLVMGSGGFFWKDPRTLELVALLKWWFEPENAVSAIGFLRAPWVAVPDTQLDEWVKQTDRESRTLLLDLFLNSGHRIAQLLSPLRDKVISPGQLLLELFNDSEGEQMLGANALKLWHFCENLSESGHDAHETLKAIDLAIERDRREKDPPPPLERGTLVVLTVHASKGLEFERVILVELSGPSKSPNVPKLFWDRAEGIYLPAKDLEGDFDGKNPENLRWKERELKRELAESKRLFYVALTRAKKNVLLVFPPRGRDSAPDPRAKFDWRGWIEETGLSIPIAERPTTHTGSPTVPSRPRTRLQRTHGTPTVDYKRPRHSITEWNLLSQCPRSYEWTYIRPRQTAEAEPKSRTFEGAARAPRELSARELGTQVHACMETADWTGIRALEERVPGTIPAEELIAWGTRLRSEAKGQIWHELTFEVPLGDGEGVTGAMDCVVKMPTEKASQKASEALRVLDYKVLQRPRPDDELLESYETQLKLYGWALGCLEPQSRNALEARIVAVSPNTLRELEIPLPPWDRLDAFARELLKQSQSIIRGEDAPARPSPKRCAHCSHAAYCDASVAID